MPGRIELRGPSDPVSYFEPADSESDSVATRPVSATMRKP
jgi:hypothetical protein